MNRRLGLIASGILAAGALVASGTAPAHGVERPYVLTKGHIDLFDISYNDATGGLQLQVKDDTGLYQETPVYREPEDVTVSVDPGLAAVAIPEDLPPDYAFLGEPGDTIYLLPQTQNENLPWPGWSTQRLLATLPAGTDIADAADAVSLSVQVDGPGDVHTYMNDAAGKVINHWVDTTDGGPDVIPVPRSSHVHTEWVFTQKGSYTLWVTPSARTTDGQVLEGPPSEYHIQVGDDDPILTETSTTLTLNTSSQRYGDRPARVGVLVRADGAPTNAGMVTLRLGGTEIARDVALTDDGAAVITLPSRLAPGRYELVADFEPSDPTLAASTSAPVVLRVTKAATVTRARVVDQGIGPSQRARLAIRVASTLRVTGKVVVAKGNLRLAKTMLNRAGKAVVTLPRMGTGTHRLVVRYQGNALYAPSTTRAVLRVRR